MLLVYIPLQLRFHIIEARKLLGENLKPTVKVVIGEEAKSTRVAMGTQNPIWNEVCTECMKMGYISIQGYVHAYTQYRHAYKYYAICNNAACSS